MTGGELQIERSFDLAPLISERIALLLPQDTDLRRLVIAGAKLDGDALIDIFETHKHHLRYVSFRQVCLTKLTRCVRARCRTVAQRLEIYYLETGNELGGGS